MTHWLKTTGIDNIISLWNYVYYDAIVPINI